MEIIGTAKLYKLRGLRKREKTFLTKAKQGLDLRTEVINDAASLLGCSVGMADDLTAITLVALGTSLPVP